MEELEVTNQACEPFSGPQFFPTPLSNPDYSNFSHEDVSFSSSDPLQGAIADSSPDKPRNSKDKLPLFKPLRAAGSNRRKITPTISLSGHLSGFDWRLLITTLSIAITGVLVGLNVGNFQWKPPGPTLGQLGGFQFAVKVHEGLIIVLLSMILLQCVDRALRGQEGTPFGFLTLPFQINSPLWLLSTEFWGAITQRETLHITTLITGILIIVFCLTALASGPSSAILMIPRQDWREFPSSLERHLNNISFLYMTASLEKLFPTSVTADEAYTWRCDHDWDAFCAYGGFAAINASLWTVLFKLGNQGASKSPLNMTLPSLQDDSGETSRVIASEVNVPPPGDNAIAYSTTAADFVPGSLFFLTGSEPGYQIAMRELQLFSRATAPVLTKVGDENTGADAGFYQPLVYVQCANLTDSTVIANESMHIYFQDGLFPPFSAEVNHSDLASLLNSPKAYTIVDLWNQFPIQPYSPILSLLVLDKSDLVANTSLAPSLPRSLALCNIDSRWTVSETWITTYQHIH